MKKYHKIVTVYKRDPATNYKTLLEGQYAMPELEYLAENKWMFTEKIDGTNIRVMWDGEKVSFGGKTDKAQMPPFLLDKLVTLFPQEKFVSLYSDISPMCLYGEGYGARIQKGGGNYIPDGVDFILFDVMVGDIWLKSADVRDVAAKLDISRVPIRGYGPLEQGIDLVKNGLESSLGVTDFLAEGLVMRPIVDMLNRQGHRIITKIKTKDFPERPKEIKKK